MLYPVSLHRADLKYLKNFFLNCVHVCALTEMKYLYGHLTKKHSFHFLHVWSKLKQDKQALD